MVQGTEDSGFRDTERREKNELKRKFKGREGEADGILFACFIKWLILFLSEPI